MTRSALLLLALSACDSKRAAPTPARGSGTDPWAGPAGSALAMPAWVKDPPLVLREKINGLNGDVVVMKRMPELTEYREIIHAAEGTPGVLAAEPFVFVEGAIAQGSAAVPDARIKAVDPARVDHVLAISRHTSTRTLAALKADEIVLGDGLAHKLGARIGDTVTVHLPAADDQPEHAGTFRVAGTLHVDFDEYDDRLGIITLAAGQTLVGRGDQVLGVEMIVKDVDHADQVAKALGETLGGPPYVVMDWYELNKQLYTAMFGDKKP